MAVARDVPPGGRGRRAAHCAGGLDYSVKPANQSTENTDELPHAGWVRSVAGNLVYGLGGLVVTPVV